MNLNEILEYCQAEALTSVLLPSDEQIWRGLCRYYSKTFHTPLINVLEMSPVHVIVNVYEDQFSGIDIDNDMEGVMDIIYTLEDPNYAKEKRDDLKDFIRRTLREEEQRLASGRAIHKSMDKEVSLKNSLPKEPTVDTKKLPQSGGINLSYLQSEESDGGFDES